MAKYDEFGRPIYETAEEYNKAHKRGNYSRTYDNPEGNAYKHETIKKTYSNQRGTGQYASQTSFKTKSMIIGIAVCVITMVVILVFSFSMVRSSYGVAEEPLEDWVDIEEVVDAEEEYIGDDTTPLPEGFETFSYNGQTYSLPTTMEEIFKMGFTLEEEYYEHTNTMIPPEYDDTLSLNNEDGTMVAMVRVSNYTDEEMPLSKCQVSYFYIENPVAYDEEATVPDFVFGDGLTLESSYEEVEAYFGVPYYHYEDHSEEDCFYDSYQWEYYGEKEIHFVSITFWNGVISDVGIEKQVIE